MTLGDDFKKDLQEGIRQGVQQGLEEGLRRAGWKPDDLRIGLALLVMFRDTDNRDLLATAAVLASGDTYSLLNRLLEISHPDFKPPPVSG